MNMNELAAKVTRLEGKRLSLSVAQVKEVIGLIADQCLETPGTLEDLLALGRRRAKAAAGKAKRK